MLTNAPQKFRQALASEFPLQIVGTVNAYTARLAQRSGFKAIYLSGGGVANASYGLPDLGMTSLADVLVDVRRIVAASDLPLLVDIDTGFGGALNISRTIKEMCHAGVAAVHIEDQQQAKRCGHRPNKAIVSQQEMVDRIKSCVDARPSDDFIIMARSDALAQYGMDEMIARLQAYVEVGADMLFPEAVTSLAQYQQITAVIDVPVLANITEFGQTPLFTCEELASAKVAMALYPLSAFRAMSRAALTVFRTLREQGTQQAVIDSMQPRTELYDMLDYHVFEQQLDALQAKGADVNDDE